MKIWIKLLSQPSCEEASLSKRIIPCSLDGEPVGLKISSVDTISTTEMVGECYPIILDIYFKKLYKQAFLLKETKSTLTLLDIISVGYWVYFWSYSSSYSNATIHFYGHFQGNT